MSGSVHPLLVVGQGEWSYSLIKSLSSQTEIFKQTIWVRPPESKMGFSQIPAAILNWQPANLLQMDTGALCRATGVHTVESGPLRVDSESQILYLENGCELPYANLVFEPEFCCLPFEGGGRAIGGLVEAQRELSLQHELEKFFLQVHQHAPKDLCIVLSGVHRLSLELALALRARLQNLCSQVRIVLLNLPGECLAKDDLKRLQGLLPQIGIELISTNHLSDARHHQMTLEGGQRLEFDIFLPLHAWWDPSLFSKSVLGDHGQFTLTDSGRLQGHESLWVLGNWCQFADGNGFLQQYDHKLYLQQLLGQLSGGPAADLRRNTPRQSLLDHPVLRTRLLLGSRKFSDRLQDWRAEWQKLSRDRQPPGPLPLVRQQDQETLACFAEHLPRSRSLGRQLHASPGLTGVVSVTSFNFWSSLESSVRRIFDLALLKAQIEGVRPEQLQFFVTTPGRGGAVSDTLLPRTLLALEGLCEKWGLDLASGQVLDGSVWRLHLTLVGQRAPLVGKKHQQSHHFILTRPLGFGALWLTRSHPLFQSEWLQEEWQTPLLPRQGSLAELTQDWPEVAITLIEDWGVWGHLLPNLAAGSQAVFNYRELPKWAGFESCVKWAEDCAGDQLNWERVAAHVSFKREDVSISNRLLWDPLSLGGLLISVPEKHSSRALCKIQQMGYTRARVVGCVRPQSRKTKLVLSDWTP